MVEEQNKIEPEWIAHKIEPLDEVLEHEEKRLKGSGRRMAPLERWLAEELSGRDYQGEFVVTSKGQYIFHCICGTTSEGSVSSNRESVKCLSDPCGLSFRVISLRLGEPAYFFIVDKNRYPTS